MEKTRKWRKILAMMLTVVMMLQNAQSVMVFADVTNEQIEQRLAGNQGQTEETQPDQSQETQQLRQRLPMQMYLQPLPRACSRRMSVEPPATSCR